MKTDGGMEFLRNEARIDEQMEAADQERAGQIQSLEIQIEEILARWDRRRDERPALEARLSTLNRKLDDLRALQGPDVEISGREFERTLADGRKVVDVEISAEEIQMIEEDDAGERRFNRGVRRVLRSEKRLATDRDVVTVEGWIRNQAERLEVGPRNLRTGRQSIFVYLRGQARRGVFSAKIPLIERTIALAKQRGIPVSYQAAR